MILKQVAIDIANAFTTWNLWRGGGGGGTTVTVDPKINTGTNIADITVDNVLKQIYSPYGTVFSTEEKIVGTFADNKPIYEKWFYYNNIYFGNNTIFNTGLSGISHAWVEGGFFTDGTSHYRLPLISGGSWVICTIMEVVNGIANIRFRANDYYNPSTAREFYFRIQYTKLTD